MTMSVRFEIFPVDLDATVDFYTRVLGFSLVVDRRGAGQPYVSFERGDVRIGAAGRPESGLDAARRPPTGVEIVLEVDDIAAELARIRASAWPLDAELVLQDWGLRDFRLLDPSRYYLRITER
jgi:predicted enzyme related to lactoylglutathione lyase